MEEEKEVSLEERVGEHIKTISDIEKSKRGFFKSSRRKKAVREFVRANPSGAGDLTDYFKARAGVVEKATTWSVETRAEKAVREYEISQNPSAIKRFIKRHPAVLPSVVAAQVLISSFSPNHPLMVDAYLADRALDSAYELVAGPKVSDEALVDFLTTKEQALEYRADMIKDLEDLSSEGFFVISEKGGKLEQTSIMTVNSTILGYVPVLDQLLDMKGIPRLDDKVDSWLQGYNHVASGHYHVDGSAVSRGDKLVSKLFPGKEVVVVNGAYDSKVFLDSELVSFGEDVKVPDEVIDYFVDNIQLLHMKPYKVEKKGISDNEPPIKFLYSFLGYLKDVGGVDISNLDEIRNYIIRKYEGEFLDYSRGIREAADSDETVFDNFRIYDDVQKQIYRSAVNNPSSKSEDDGMVTIDGVTVPRLISMR